MLDASYLLNDEQMRQFISEGYVILHTDFPESFHQQMSVLLNEVYEQEGNPGNNLLPRIPDLQKVFDHPIIQGALSSVLGPDYMMHPHRHGHFNRVAEAGGWHKDSYWGHYKMRNHHPWWAMIFYYPQDVTLDMGPTGIMPGTQCYQTRTFEANETNTEVKSVGKAGTFALVHYDIWHRANANMAGKDRYMLKFQFMRTRAPQKPSWNNETSEWINPASFTSEVYSHEVIWREHWDWLSGRAPGEAARNAAETNQSGQVGAWIDNLTAEDPSTRVQAADQLAKSNVCSLEVLNVLEKALQDDFEPVALNAAYGLARRGQKGVEVLLQAMEGESAAAARIAAYGASVAGKSALDSLIQALASPSSDTAAHAAFALGELGASAAIAVPSLIKVLSSENEKLRRNVIEALGIIGNPVDTVVKGLEIGLQDTDTQVRFMAGMAFTKMGVKAEAAVPALAQALEDENRYVRATAVDALYTIGSEKAKDILLRFLRTSRWCSSTTPNNTF